MKNHVFHIEAAHQAARFRIIESCLLETIEGTERYLTKLDKLRESTAQLKEAWQKRLDNVIENPSADRARKLIKRKIRDLDTNFANAEKKSTERWDTIRASLQKYLAEKKRSADYVAAQAEIQQHTDSVAEEASGGTTLWGTLGQALFALKASNAFDDLAKLSGRKK